MFIDKIARLKKAHTIVSIILFVGILIYSFLAADMNLLADPLSKFSLHNQTSIIWIFCLLILNYVVCVDTVLAIRNSEISKKTILYIGTTISSLSLLGLTIFNMSAKTNAIHTIFAAIFFFTYAITIFGYGISLIKIDFRTAMTSIVASILLLLSLTWLAFKIFAIPEISYIVICYGWNLTIMFNTEWKAFLKRIGF